MTYCNRMSNSRNSDSRQSFGINVGDRSLSRRGDGRWALGHTAVDWRYIVEKL